MTPLLQNSTIYLISFSIFGNTAVSVWLILCFLLWSSATCCWETSWGLALHPSGLMHPLAACQATKGWEQLLLYFHPANWKTPTSKRAVAFSIGLLFALHCDSSSFVAACAALHSCFVLFFPHLQHLYNSVACKARTKQRNKFRDKRADIM